MPTREAEFALLSAHLARRRGAILEAWRAAVTADPTLTTGASLPRAQLHDHIPALLVDFEHGLASGHLADGSLHLEGVQRADAAAHGLHRWQQGFDLSEVTRELGRLNECVVDELEDYDASHATLDSGVMAAARRLWARQYGVAVSASAAQYFHLKKLEASSHIKDLEEALATLRHLEQERARLWQQAAHDLRGNLGVVANATAGLVSPSASEVARASFLRMLDRNVAALHRLLDDVTGLARLQAGQEHRRLEPIDVAALLRELCEGLAEPAESNGLYLRFNGPPTLKVMGDRVKTRRVAQNLVLNAVKYTRQGGITVSWGEVGQDGERWYFEVADTGPGLHAGPGAPLAGALEVATEQSRQVAADERSKTVSHVDTTDPGQRADIDQRPVHQASGEGIGLSSVKRLCDLLDATIEVESTIEVGTKFRVVLPQRYEPPAPG